MKQISNIRKAGDSLYVIFICILSALCFVSFAGRMPGTGLDPSWVYVTAYARAHHFTFGQDIIFTFGPFASLYTRFFLPENELEYLFISTTLSTLFCLALWRMNNKLWRYAIGVLPLIFANLILLDAFFLVMPILAVLLVRSINLKRRYDFSLLLAIAGASGMLPLVKGTFAVPAYACLSGMTAVLLIRKQPKTIIFVTIPVIFMLACWVYVGQSISLFIEYYFSSIYLAAGYTDSMSLFGHGLEAIEYIICSIGLLLAIVIPSRLTRLPEVSVCACVLFISFKAAFVREHMFIAGSTLILISFVLVMNRPDRFRSSAAVLASLVGLYFCSFEATIGIRADWQRFQQALAASTKAIVRQLSDTSSFEKDFNEANKAIAAVANVPPTNGSIDIYSYDQSLLLSTHRIYSPRPIFQSYAVYTPMLEEINRDRLVSNNAPQTILFSPQPIDERYPSLEDGLSWPELLSIYHANLYYKEYIILEHRIGITENYTIDTPIVSDNYRFDHRIDIPDIALAWARIRFELSFIGKISSLLWKSAYITMELTYQDGHTARYRMIPSMSNSGFLLSPTVLSARDFVALRSTDSEALAEARVKSILFHQEGSYSLWGETFHVDIARLHVPHLTAADTAGMLVQGAPIALLSTGGYCSIDTVEGQLTSVGGPVHIKRQNIQVTGWALGANLNAGSLGTLRVGVQPLEGGPTLYAETNRYLRPDVDTVLHLGRHLNVGFSSQVDFRDLPDGLYKIYLVQDAQGGAVVCSSSVIIER